jgi:GTP:adenosylcobinamide-phosphate guanylyltransferase
MDQPEQGQASVTAVVLAGGGAEEAFEAAAGVAHRALAEVGGRPMIATVLDALRGSRAIGRVILIGGPEVAAAGAVDALLPSAGGLVENVMQGMRACGDAGFALLVTADLPFLTTEAVDALIEAGVASGAGFCYPVIGKEENERRFPGMRRTYVRLAEGIFTGGNLFFTRPAVLLAQEERIRRAYAWRKQPWRLTFLFGPTVLWRLYRGTLTLAQLEARASQVFGVPVRALVLPYAELGADIDRPEDLEAARRLAGRMTGSRTENRGEVPP